MVLTRLLAERARLHVPHFEVAAAHIVMDNVPYASSATYLQQYCSALGVPLHILHARFDTDTRQRPACFLCSWHRRKTLFQFAQQEGYNKVALGHHQDDLLVTLLMNLTFEGSFSTMAPLLPMEHYPINLIRPLCLVPEALIREFATTEGIQPPVRQCPYENTTRRTTMTEFLHQLEAINPEARYSLLHALQKANNTLFANLRVIK